MSRLFGLVLAGSLFAGSVAGAAEQAEELAVLRYRFVELSVKVGEILGEKIEYLEEREERASRAAESAGWEEIAEVAAENAAMGAEIVARMAETVEEYGVGGGGALVESAVLAKGWAELAADAVRFGRSVGFR